MKISYQINFVQALLGGERLSTLSRVKGMLSKQKTQEVLSIMYEMFPNAKCELNYQTPFQLLIAVILSAQTTDIAVNKVTPKLFENYPTAQALAQAKLDDIILHIKSIG